MVTLKLKVSNHAGGSGGNFMSVTSDMLEIIPSANAVSVHSTPLSGVLLLLRDPELRPVPNDLSSSRYLRFCPDLITKLNRHSPRRQTLMARHRAWTVQISRSSTIVIRSWVCRLARGIHRFRQFSWRRCREVRRLSLFVRRTR
jgi:hypothetical protein